MKFEENIEGIKNEKLREFVKGFSQGKFLRLGASTFEVFMPFYDPYKHMTSNVKIRINAVRKDEFHTKSVYLDKTTEDILSYNPVIFSTEELENFIEGWQEVLALLKKFNDFEMESAKEHMAYVEAEKAKKMSPQ